MVITFDEAYNYVVQQIQTNHFFNAAALSSILFSIAYYLKALPFRIWARLERYFRYSVTVEQTDEAARALDYYISVKFPNSLRRTEASTVNGQIQYSHENDYIYTWHKYRYIRIGKVKERLTNASNSDNMFARTYGISGMFARNQIKDFLLLAKKVYEQSIEEEKKNKERIKLYVRDQWGGLRSRKVNGKKFDDIFTSGKEEIINDVERFIQRKQLHKRLHIPYKRGYLFYGRPGNGKSAIAYALAEKLKYDIVLLDIADLDNDTFKRVLDAVDSKAVVVFEDIDTIFNGRETVAGKKLDFGTFLNALSGISVKEEIITIITTNKLETVDPALLRAGRCDMVKEICPPRKIDVEEFLSVFYNKPITLSHYSEVLNFVDIQDLALNNPYSLENFIYDLQLKINDGIKIQESSDFELSI